jgi:hypothetical protein
MVENLSLFKKIGTACFFIINYSFARILFSFINCFVLQSYMFFLKKQTIRYIFLLKSRKK